MTDENFPENDAGEAEVPETVEQRLETRKEASSRGPNPEHPNERTSQSVQALVAAGLRQIDIASYLKISTKTLHAHYKDELDRGAAQVFADVGNRIVERARKEDDWQAQKLIATTRMGWATTAKIEDVPPAPEGEDNTVDELDRIMENATLEELEVIDALIDRTYGKEPEAGSESVEASASED